MTNHIPVFQVFIYCNGKCGSSTLEKTFSSHGFATLKLHGALNLSKQNKFDDSITLKDIIRESIRVYGSNNIYIFDAYRFPIERKISSFFENIRLQVPDYTTMSVPSLIDVFNSQFLHVLEEYEAIHEIMNDFKVDLFRRETDLYSVPVVDGDGCYLYKQSTENNGVHFIKLYYENIENWECILNHIRITLHMSPNPIRVYPMNLSVEKQSIRDLYEAFKTQYKLPFEFLLEKLMMDVDGLKRYVSLKDQIKYLEKWKLRSK
jgi:hypothetical protein